MEGNRLDRKELSAFADAVAAWLDYQIHCGRSSLLSERYMTQPIADFLGSKFGAEAIHAEWKLGKEKDKRGRPRQMDFAVKSKAAAQPTMVIETKWVANFDAGQKQGVVMDIMRLHAFPWKKKERLKSDAQKLFMLAGTSAAMGRAFKSGSNNRSGPRTPFLSSVLSTKLREDFHVRPGDLDGTVKVQFDAFSEDYGLALPTTYKSRLVGEQSLKTIQVLVWEVRRV